MEAAEHRGAAVSRCSCAAAGRRILARNRHAGCFQWSCACLASAGRPPLKSQRFGLWSGFLRHRWEVPGRPLQERQRDPFFVECEGAVTHVHYFGAFHSALCVTTVNFLENASTDEATSSDVTSWGKKTLSAISPTTKYTIGTDF